MKNWGEMTDNIFDERTGHVNRSESRGDLMYKESTSVRNVQ